MEQTNLFHCRILLVILLLLLRIPATLSEVVRGSITTDKIALLNLERSMTIDHVLFTNWTADPHSSVCSWMGVNCTSNSNKRVQELKLSGMGLKGHIPPELGRLSALVRLDLSNNFLDGGFPVEICNLFALKFLDMSSNNLTGYIPDGAVELKNLTHLSLANNQFIGPIPKNISHLEKLELLDLSFNNLSGGFPGEPLEWLSQRNLRHLNVSYNKLKGKVPCGGKLIKLPKDAFKSNDHLGCHCPPLYSAKRTSLFTGVFMGAAIGLLALGFTFVALKHVLASVNSYKQLHEATNGFDENNKLKPEGRFGSVYKGSLCLPNLGNDGKEAAQKEVVAVKVFKLEEVELKNFEAESKRLRAMASHPNLTPVIGSCSLTSLAMVIGCGIYSEFKALVTKFMPKGSLEGCLHSEECSMNIKLRLEIMFGVASGLEYLHERGLLHGDLKPRNVLLDEEMVACLSDFGITKSEKSNKTKKRRPTSDEEQAKTQPASDEEQATSDPGSGEKTKQEQPTSDEEKADTLRTPGYSDPESELKTSAKSDVYSFGIMLMETFTGKKPTDQMFHPESSLRDWVKEALDSRTVNKVVDARLIRDGEVEFEAKVECVSSILKLALNCSEESATDRMDVKDVVEKLRTILQDVQLP